MHLGIPIRANTQMNPRDVIVTRLVGLGYILVSPINILLTALAIPGSSNESDYHNDFNIIAIILITGSIILIVVGSLIILSPKKFHAIEKFPLIYGLLAAMLLAAFT